MPTASKRRRKFYGRNKIYNRNISKNQSDQTSKLATDDNTSITTKTNKCIFAANTSNKTKSKNYNSCDKTTSITKIFAETVDKDKSLDPDIHSMLSSLSAEESKGLYFDQNNEQSHATPINRERNRTQRQRHSRQHKVKVRSPKRRLIIDEPIKSADSMYYLTNKKSIGTIAISWEQEFSMCSTENNVNTGNECAVNEEITSDHSIDDMCRICHGGDQLSQDLGRLVSTCACRGTVGRVHVKCLERWLTESRKNRCELCGTRYTTRRVHRYGIPRALLMWLLSQNAKQLMVDSLGIMLMSPLAILAAWLSGRTIAGLMTQDNHVTPWPLASTFVLACMTLVCYYCWIVTAATRHALGWWIWYHSQYEVRLQMQENEE